MERQLRILHLEDNPYDAELIRRELARAGIDFESLQVSTDRDFRAALAGDVFDVVLADYNLPGFDGMAALGIAADAAPDTPFIFVSGAIGEERAVEALRHGATDYIFKDRLSRLSSAIVRAIAERDERSRHNATQEELRISRERFILASHATQDVIWDWSLYASTFWANDALASEWGYRGDPAHVPMEWWLAQMHPAEAAAVHANFNAATESTATRWHFRYRLRRGDGRYGHVDDRGMIVRDASGRAIRVIGAMQDITARVEAERELEQEQRISSLGRVAAVIAHEFNNVLMGIQPFAEVVKKKSGADTPIANAAQHIISAVARGRQITRDILRAANPGEPAIETVDLASWLRDAAADLNGRFTNPASLSIDVPDAPVLVRVDPQQLHQVIANLAINARDAMAGTGRLAIVMTTRGDEVSIRVADTGPGIPEDVLPRIFDPLFTTKKTGTGLGLSVAKQIVTRNGGRIAVDSVVGSGTVFTLTFPMAIDTEPEGEPVADDGQAPVPVRRLLIVDDDVLVVEGMKMLLELEGFEVRYVTRAAEVRNAVREFDPDLVILDLTLPDGHGTEVYRLLATSDPNLPVVFASGDAEPPHLAEWRTDARVTFVSKPYDFATLLERMREVVA
jgi:sigma-B regulation protein RsbU (phosphoserine phosphatase)